jgi:hypothetical protein
MWIKNLKRVKILMRNSQQKINDKGGMQRKCRSNSRTFAWVMVANFSMMGNAIGN